jgi:hypothetical protein
MENVYQTIGGKCSELSRIKVNMINVVETKLMLPFNSLTRAITRNIYRQIYSNLLNQNYDKH